ncbi:glycosyltransferase family protein [Crocinitomix catalasitica]|uniref:hypothetical protein n=1 Tax=Crocinitomix catalasitica TaxID=184607 RepID=UPI00048017B7|nr:hypothetical protein [Crocinitomix catalasitica]
MKNKKILLISPEPWGENFVSKHHYANYLSLNNEVYFLNPPTTFSKIPFASMGFRSNKIHNNLTQIDYLNLVPKLNDLPTKIQDRIYKIQAKKIQKHLKIDNFDLVWTFDPNRFFQQSVWEAGKRIYHTVDVHSGKSREEVLAKTSDLVLLSSALLRERLNNYNSNIVKTGHAADIINFEKHKHAQMELPGQNTIKAGLISNFNGNVDYDLIELIADFNPNIDFIFVGPFETNNLGKTPLTIQKRVAELKKRKNVYFVGAQPAQELIKWMNSFDINLVLYREDKRDIIINPHKMMGYFYAGNITISSWFNEYKERKDELLLMTNNNEELPELIKKTSLDLKHWNRAEAKEFRRQFAIDNSYQNKINQIAKILYN